MPSIFSPSDNAALQERIQKLAADTPAQWGKMNAAQMLAHCQVPIRVALGEVKLKRGIIGLLFGGSAKRKYILSDKAFERDLPTDPNFLMKDARDFDTEKAGLLPLVQRFAQQGTVALTQEAHPFFGKMNAEEWDTLMWKHLDHHLRQFGV